MEDIILHNGVTIPSTSLTFRFSRSGGKGGQNVNKVATKVELVFHLADLRVEPGVLGQVMSNLRDDLDSKGNLRIVSQESRSQWQNKLRCMEKLSSILSDAMIVSAVRYATKPTRSSKQKRLTKKKIHSARKSIRSKKSFNDE